MSADGRTVAFERGAGACAQTIDTVPVNGGRERVLIAMSSNGNRAVIPSSPPYSGDGRYLGYQTTGCSVSSNVVIHVRNLRTGRELTGSGYLGYHAVFVNRNRQIGYVDAGRLVIVTMPSFARRTYAPPHGCSYWALAGTETTLVAAVACTARPVVSLAVISTRTFTVTRVLLRLGRCQACTSLSLTASDPAELLVATNNPCGAGCGPGAIFVVRGRTARLVLSRPALDLPYEIAW